MFCRIFSSAIYGISCVPVTIELDISNGMPVFIMVGSVSSKVKESQDRVRTALKNLGIGIPPKRITLNLSPGDIKKDSTRFDLPIAAALLTALGKINPDSLNDCMVIGELHLNGDIEGIPGVLPSVLAARTNGINKCIVPYENRNEASSVENMRIIALKHLSELIDFCDAEEKDKFTYKSENYPIHERNYPDFSEIKGQSAVKRAMLISAAGFHNILMSGVPGSGKSMAAKRIPSILPDLTKEEQIEVSRIYSVSGLLTSDKPLIRQRPFRSPHHLLSPQALCGGGTVPKPGEITLAHRGVLFIDELPEMPGRTLEQLRGPMEDHSILISRSNGSFLFPANFLFAAAMNPCPCGYYPDMNKCRCSPYEVHRYISHISQPILDRIDIRVNVPAPSYRELTSSEDDSIGSSEMKKHVEKAFSIQKERYSSEKIQFNSELGPSGIKKYCTTTKEAGRLLKSAFSKLDLSARSYHRILKLSRTIADLDESDRIAEQHISEAFMFRNESTAKLKTV